MQLGTEADQVSGTWPGFCCKGAGGSSWQSTDGDLHSASDGKECPAAPPACFLALGTGGL